MSDWSSDVCSSDLAGPQGEFDQRHQGLGHQADHENDHHELEVVGDHVGPVVRRQIAIERLLAVDRLADAVGDQGIGGPQQAVAEQRDDRSEEHTSELQSLMRISYAVFCLNKKNITNEAQHTSTLII